MREYLTMTDKEIVDAFNKALDVQYIDDIDELVFTAETLDDFREARNGYRESGRTELDSPSALAYRGIQVRKGDTRRDVFVVDLGAVRAVLA